MSTITINETKIEVTFSFKVDKDDKNPTKVTTWIDFSGHTAEDLMTRVAADSVIDIQRRLRSGSLSVEDRKAIIDENGKVLSPAMTGINGREFTMPKPGSRSKLTAEEKILALAKKLGISETQLKAMLGAEKSEA